MTTQTGRLTLVLTLAVAVAVATGLFVTTVEGGPGITDTAIYRKYGEKIVSGELPYRDFGVEYPPGALVPFIAPALVTSDRPAYDKGFRALMIAALAAVAVLIVLSQRALAASGGRTAFAVGAFLSGVALLGPFALTRFDYYAAALTLATICAALYRRERLAAIILGVAIATKIYPAVLVPLFVARDWRRDGARTALARLAVTIATALVIYLPFLILSPEGVGRSVWRQVGRPLQIESFGAAVLLALHHAAGMPLDWASSNGSQNLTGTVATVASLLTTVVGVLALVLVWVRFARGDVESSTRFVRYCAAAIVAFVAFGKVISPQFLVWLLAVVVLVGESRGTIASSLLLLACFLTRLWFPNTYWDLVKKFDETASWLVLVRDAVLVALFVVLVARVRAREPAPAGSQSPAR